MSLLSFAIMLLLATILTLIIHEVGHIIPIIIFNIVENKPYFAFKIEINVRYFYVVHEKFRKHHRNLIVAFSGSLFPIVIAHILLIISSNQFTNLLIFLSYGNLLMLHPRLPDGQNIEVILQEMRDDYGKNI